MSTQLPEPDPDHADADSIDDLPDDAVVLHPPHYNQMTVHLSTACDAVERCRSISRDRVSDLKPGYSLCRKPACFGEANHPGSAERECPYCGDTINRFHAHLPCDGGGQA